MNYYGPVDQTGRSPAKIDSLGVLSVLWSVGYSLLGWKFLKAVIAHHYTLFLGKALVFLVLGAWFLPLLYVTPFYPLDYVPSGDSFSSWTALGILLVGIGLSDCLLLGQQIHRRGAPQMSVRTEGGAEQG